MKNFLAIISILLFSFNVFSQKVDTSQKKIEDINEKFLNENIIDKDPIGLIFGLDFKSNYILRGAEVYDKKVSALFPWASMHSNNSSFSFTYCGEYAVNSITQFGKASNPYKQYDSADFGINGVAIVDGDTEFGFGSWYYWHYMSKNDLRHDTSYATFSLYAKLGALPMSPMLSYNHDLYVDENAIIGKNFYSDFYIELALIQDINITSSSTIFFGVLSGYYNNLTKDRKGISNVTSIFKFSTNINRFTYYGKFNFIINPKGDFSKIVDDEGNRSHEYTKWFLEFGLSASL